jgi:hypothetical protein
MVRKWWFRHRLAGQVALLSAASALIVFAGVSLDLGGHGTKRETLSAAAIPSAVAPQPALRDVEPLAAAASAAVENTFTKHASQPIEAAGPVGVPSPVEAAAPAEPGMQADAKPVEAAPSVAQSGDAKPADAGAASGRQRLALVSVGALEAPREAIPGSQPALDSWLPSHDPGPATTQAVGAPLPATPQTVRANLEPSRTRRPERFAALTGDTPQRASEPRPAGSMPAPSSTFSSMLLGKWVPHKDACTDPDATDYLPLLISRSKATAGDGTCTFVSKKRVGKLWNVVAECSDGDSTWTSNVSLSAARGELTWSSERGAQSYVRCAPDTVVAKAPKKATVASAPAKKPKVATRKPASVQVVRGAPAAGNPGWVVLKLP